MEHCFEGLLKLLLQGRYSSKCWLINCWANTALPTIISLKKKKVFPWQYLFFFFFSFWGCKILQKMYVFSSLLKGKLNTFNFYLILQKSVDPQTHFRKHKCVPTIGWLTSFQLSYWWCICKQKKSLEGTWFSGDLPGVVVPRTVWSDSICSLSTTKHREVYFSTVNVGLRM